MSNGVSVTLAGAAPGEAPLVLAAWDPASMAEWISACHQRGFGR